MSIRTGSANCRGAATRSCGRIPAARSEPTVATSPPPPGRSSSTSSGSPICGLSVSPGTGGIGATFTARCTVTPGVGPPSTGLGVSLNAASVDGGIVTLLDDGVAPDTTAGDNIFSGSVTVGLNATNGPKTVIST